jgi:hypothetical protein
MLPADLLSPQLYGGVSTRWWLDHSEEAEEAAKHPIAITIINFIIIASIFCLVDHAAKNGRLSWRLLSTNATGFPQGLVWNFLTHMMWGSGAENLWA